MFMALTLVSLANAKRVITGDERTELYFHLAFCRRLADYLFADYYPCSPSSFALHSVGFATQKFIHARKRFYYKETIPFFCQIAVLSIINIQNL